MVGQLVNKWEMSVSVASPNENETRNENAIGFERRHLGPSDEDVAQMCKLLGVNGLEELVEEVVPASIRGSRMSEMPAHSEPEMLNRLRELAGKNQIARSWIGLGYHACHTPSVILRNVLENPAWYTAYTPYQPEISQGRLEALLNFQTMISELTGLEVSNASLLDEGTAAAEAMLLCRRVSKQKSERFLVSRDTHPQTVEVLKTRALPQGVQVVVVDLDDQETDPDCFGALFQYPGTSGEVPQLEPAIQRVRDQGGLAVVAADPLALTLLKSPGELGADIAVGTTQRFGVPLFFGGPHAGYLATRDQYKRSVPGRIIGVSRDQQGNVALRMALQTREQHIRRDRATSNICTSQALLAMISAFYAMYHGPEGLRAIAEKIHRQTCWLASRLRDHGYEIENERWFDSLTVRVEAAATIHQAAGEQRINFRHIDAEHIGIALDETTTDEDLVDILNCFVPAAIDRPDFHDVWSPLDQACRRTGPALSHPVFQRYRSETEMMRYLRRLADKDLALDRTMIPLGSCTMKLNSATEMIPVSWPEFANIHPFAPMEQTQGYQELISELESMLCDVTGYDAVSLQPNAGSQGEFSGLLAIQAYHANRGEPHRNICLIPSSAHGTNPASASMAGMKIVVINCDEAGNVNVDDLREKAEAHRENLSCIMITYPSTHGVFEERIVEICDIVHENGGQVYIDGANLNAQVGLCDPGRYGGDVSHLNLHKTFCIPHGGGGPGVGPVAVKDHLAPFLPSEKNFNHENSRDITESGSESMQVGAVSSAPYGSAGILSISWAYIYMMGSRGLRRASEVALLNANYVAERLKEHFPILYTGKNGRIAHECIVDIRPLTKETGITVDDVAKRLVDYGFHAPTMSFPVAGTLMIEPTESESREELDRFCDAMISIRQEIDRVARGEFDAKDNPLVHAPHTAEVLTADQWDHSYSRTVAAFPTEQTRENKYWVPVSRVDNAYGDRHLICSCPAVEDYRD